MKNSFITKWLSTPLSQMSILTVGSNPGRDMRFNLGSFGPHGHRIDFCEGTVQLIVIGTLFHRPSPLPLGIPGGYFDKKKIFTFLKISSKRLGNTCVTRTLRTGWKQKYESIRINLRELTWSQVCLRDPRLLYPWIPGTKSGTNHGILSKCKTLWITEDRLTTDDDIQSQWPLPVTGT